MSLVSIRAGIRVLCAGAALAFGLTISTASQAQNDGSLEAMFKSSSGSYGSVVSTSAGRSRALSQPRAQRSGTATRRSRDVQVASLGGGYSAPKPRSLGGSGGINWVASAGCLSGSLRGVVSHVASNYGSVTVSSTCREHGQNRRAGGAPKSYHLSGDAVDFRVHGNVSAAAAYLSGLGGGYKHMGGGLFHVDTGPRRPMH
jgi:hypothetical protein